MAEYTTATREHAEKIHDVLQTTIRAIYPKYYPSEVAEFFCNLHNLDHVFEGIESGNVGVCIADGEVIGTGCFDGNHITGVCVLPQYQGRGLGSHIIDCLEKKIGEAHDVACFDASLPAVCLYERRGYKTVGHEIIELDDGVKLVYEKMEKRLGSVKRCDVL